MVLTNEERNIFNNTAAKLFTNLVKQCGDDYDHNCACADCDRRVHIRKLAKEAIEDTTILFEELQNGI